MKTKDQLSPTEIILPSTGVTCINPETGQMEQAYHYEEVKGTYFEFLGKQFTKFRNSPGWETMRGLHDEEDQEFFDRLESSWKAGHLKVEGPDEKRPA